MLVWIVSCLVFLPLYTTQYLNYVNDHYIKEYVLVANALNKVMDAMYFDAENVNIDGMLGTIIAEAQLNLILQEIQTKGISYQVISKLKNKTRKLNRLLNYTIEIPSSVHNTLLNVSSWENKVSFKNAPLLHFFIMNWIKIPHTKLISFMTRNGPPNEEESEFCINELLNSIPGAHEENYCIPSTKCVNIMSQLEESNGYPLTHKLLYVQVARLMKCNMNKNVMQKRIHFLCSRILQEFRTIEEIKMESAALQDLYFEQMVLCGIEGYSEFLTFKSRENLLSWQSKYGCYGMVPHAEKRWRQKRDISYMKYGCESHITGLAAAALAVNLNFMISKSNENTFSERKEDYIMYL